MRIMRIIRKQCIYDLQWFEIFRKRSLFSTFRLFRISTPVMRMMLTMENIV